jgi:hypothetical protein
VNWWNNRPIFQTKDHWKFLFFTGPFQLSYQKDIWLTLYIMLGKVQDLALVSSCTGTHFCRSSPPPPREHFMRHRVLSRIKFKRHKKHVATTMSMRRRLREIFLVKCQKQGSKSVLLCISARFEEKFRHKTWKNYLNFFFFFFFFSSGIRIEIWHRPKTASVRRVKNVKICKIYIGSRISIPSLAMVLYF